MEDEEVAESWEEAADSGVSRDRSWAAGAPLVESRSRVRLSPPLSVGGGLALRASRRLLGLLKGPRSLFCSGPAHVLLGWVGLG